MDKRKRSAPRWRTLALLATGVLVGTMLVAPPAGAHFRAKIAHIAKHMKTLFYTKAQSNGRFVNGQEFLIKLQGGQQRLIARNGAVSLVAECAANIAGNDRVRILAATTQDGAVLRGTDSLTGAPGSTLDTTTPGDNREFQFLQFTANSTLVTSNIDRGFVMAPNGKMLSIDAETLALGVNYAGAKCVLAGVVTRVG